MGTERCNFCATIMEAKDLKRCGGCKAAFYCSKECQKRYWKMVHKAVCALQTAQGRDTIEDPEEKAQTKKVTRWINAWSPAITGIWHVADSNSTRSLVISVQQTDLNEDARLFKVTEAAIQPCADVIRLVPELERALTSLPGPSEWPRLHCLVFVLDRDDPTQKERVRVHSWCAPNLREDFSNFGKGYSRVVAKQAIPLLVCEINGAKRPEEVVKKFHLLVGGPDIVHPFLDVLDMGIVDGDGGELLQECLEQLLDGSDEKKRGSGS